MSAPAISDSVADLPLHLGARVGRSLFVALAHVHAAGIIHRDVKPENIVVYAPDHVFLVDFGIACVVGEREELENDLTTQDAVLGSLAYAAPEQIDDSVATVAGDLYAAGAVLYELLCGRLPFEGPSGAAILSMKRWREAPRVSSRIAAAIPAALDDLVRRLLARDPAQRPATAAQVVHELDEAMSQG